MFVCEYHHQVTKVEYEKEYVKSLRHMAFSDNHQKSVQLCNDSLFVVIRFNIRACIIAGVNYKLSGISGRSRALKLPGVSVGSEGKGEGLLDR